MYFCTRTNPVLLNKISPDIILWSYTNPKSQSLGGQLDELWRRNSEVNIYETHVLIRQAERTVAALLNA